MLDSAFRQPDGTYKMTTISPRLGSGLWHAGSTAAGYISRQLRHGAGDLADTLVGYRPCVVADRALLAEWGGQAPAERKGIHVWHSGDLDGAAQYLAELDTRAVALRPDRYVFGTATDAAALEALVRALPPNPARI